MEEVASTRSDPVALLVVHGIGSQEAGETIEGLVNGLRKIYGQSMNVDWLNKKHARIGGIGRPVHLVEVFWADLLKGDIVKGSFNFDRIFEILWFPILNHRSGCLPTEHYSRRHVLGRTVALVTLGPLLNAGLVGARFLMIPIETVAIFWKELKLPLNERRAARQLRKSGKNFFQAARAIADERALEHYLIDDVMDQVVGDVFNFVMGTAKAFEEETEQTRLITANTAMIQRRFSEAAMEATAQGCGEVQVLSHSLGTLVAYLSMSPRTQQNNGSAKPAKLTKFYTIGSPLEKVRFFWSRLVENDHCGPTIVGNEGVVAVPGDQMSWDNFFSESDLVSGRLKSFRGWPTPKNRPVSGLGGLISSHVAYNSNSGFLEILCEELCGIAHYTMRGAVIVEEGDDYETWLANQSTFHDLNTAPAGNPVVGAAQYAVCAACHGQQGEGIAAMNAPKIAGQSAWYLKRQLMNYKKGFRGTHEGDVYGAQMIGMVATLVDQQAVDNVVAHILTFPDSAVSSTIEGDVASGQKYYNVCAYCHGGDGMGIQAMNAPRAAGMSDWYMERQLHNFKDEVRGGHPQDYNGKQMGFMADNLHDDQAVKDVIAYINTL